MTEVRPACRELLLVEDDADSREMLAMLLDLHGWQVTVATSGEEALERLSSDTFRVVVLDNRMPGMSGLEVVERLAREGAAATIVFLSGADDVADRLLELGVRHYLRKPVDLSRLLSILEQECPPTPSP